MKLGHGVVRHFYAFFLREDPMYRGWPIYDRTFPDAQSASRWIREDPEHRFYTINCLPRRYWR